MIIGKGMLGLSIREHCADDEFWKDKWGGALKRIESKCASGQN
jgi:hypothetical protein